jgi:hypothetical protein
LGPAPSKEIITSCFGFSSCASACVEKAASAASSRQGTDRAGKERITGFQQIKPGLLAADCGEALKAAG